MRISDWSSDVCSSDLLTGCPHATVKGSTSAGCSTIVPSRSSSSAPSLIVAGAGRAESAAHNTPKNRSIAIRTSASLIPTSSFQAPRTSFTASILRVATSFLPPRSEEHTSELQPLMRISYAVFCLKKKHYITNDSRAYDHQDET